MFTFPAYPKKPHATGLARVRIRGKDFYLGKFGSEESRREYARLAAEFAANPVIQPPPKSKPSKITIGDMVSLWVQVHGGREAEQVAGALKPLLRMHGHEQAGDFSAAKLEDLREAMIDCTWMSKEEKAERIRRKKLPGWSRNHVNHQIGRIKRVFRWAERKGYVPRGTWEHLRTLPRLEKDSRARRNSKRKPVDESVVEKTLPYMPFMVQSMVRVELATGMRPSELVKMKAGDVDRTGDVWLYRLTEFKTDGLDDAAEWQTVVMGPDAQAALGPWLDAAGLRGPDSPVWVYGLSKPRIVTAEAYYQAIVEACNRAGVPRWTPYQCRHSAKRRAEQAGGEQGARAFLRQRAIESTRQYADAQDIELAKKIAMKIG